MKNNHFIILQIIILIVISIFIIEGSGIVNDLNGVLTVSNFNLTLNEDGNYTMTYDLTSNKDLDLVWVEVKFYNSKGKFAASYMQPVSNIKKGQVFKINDTFSTKSLDSSVDTTPKTAKVFVRGKDVGDGRADRHKIILLAEYGL